MSAVPEAESPARDALDAAAVFFSFADPVTRLYGLARLGLSGVGEERRGSALAVLFHGPAPVAAITEGDVRVPAGAGLESLALPGLAAGVERPLDRWSLRMSGECHGFDLTFEAASPPALRGALAPARGREQLCSVRGEAVLDGQSRPVNAQGQRGVSWGSPDWSHVAAVHTVSAWFGDRGVVVDAVRELGAPGHDADARWGAVLDSTQATEVADPRLSTTYDGFGRQRRAGLELWLEGEEAPRRAAGSLLCGSSLELGQLRLDCSFMRWTMEGAEGIGRYDVLRRA